MKISFFLIIILFSVKLHAGAPAPKGALPEPPYTFKKGTLINYEVEWNRDSIKEYLTEEPGLKEPLLGGIDIFLTKYDLPILKINYAIIWINYENKNKKIILSFIGPNENSLRLIENILKNNTKLSKNRITKINNKISKIKKNRI